MLTNVKGQIQGIGGWIGSSIPKLRKGEEQPQDVPAEQNEQNNMIATEPSTKPPKDDDDNSR